jgi:hypothetical protein
MRTQRSGDSLVGIEIAITKLVDAPVVESVPARAVRQ